MGCLRGGGTWHFEPGGRRAPYLYDQPGHPRYVLLSAQYLFSLVCSGPKWQVLTADSLRCLPLLVLLILPFGFRWQQHPQSVHSESCAQRNMDERKECQH